MIQIVDRPLGRSDQAAGTQDRGIKRGEVRTRNQHGDDQHVAHGLTALELHHRGRDEVLMAVAPLPPAVYDRVQQHHIQAGKERRIADPVHN